MNFHGIETKVKARKMKAGGPECEVGMLGWDNLG